MSDETELAQIKAELKYIRRDLDKIADKMDEECVTRAHFQPIQRLVYGVIAVVGSSILVAVMANVLHQQ